MPYVTVTIFLVNTCGKFQPVSNFTELHAVTLATRSYALLVDIINDEKHVQKHLYM